MRLQGGHVGVHDIAVHTPARKQEHRREPSAAQDRGGARGPVALASCVSICRYVARKGAHREAKLSGCELQFVNLLLPEQTPTAGRGEGGAPGSRSGVRSAQSPGFGRGRRLWMDSGVSSLHPTACPRVGVSTPHTSCHGLRAGRSWTTGANASGHSRPGPRVVCLWGTKHLQSRVMAG